MARLVFDRDGVDVIAHELIGDCIRIGRAPSNDIVLDDQTVSAQEASLIKSASAYRLKDLRSINGTQSNGVCITDTPPKFDLVISREFSGAQRLALIRPGDCRFPMSTTARADRTFQKHSQFFVRSHTETFSLARCADRSRKKTSSFVCRVGFLSPVGRRFLSTTKPKSGTALGGAEYCYGSTMRKAITDEQSGLLTRIGTTESVSLCTQTKSPRR
jgi:hypothetical protein